MFRRPDMQCERGSALVIALVVMTILMGLAVSADMAVKRTALQLRQFEMRTRLNLITEAAVSDILKGIDSKKIPLMEIPNLLDSKEIQFHDAIKNIDLRRDKTSEIWFLTIESNYEEGQREVNGKKQVRFQVNQDRCQILNFIDL